MNRKKNKTKNGTKTDSKRRKVALSLSSVQSFHKRSAKASETKKKSERKLRRRRLENANKTATAAAAPALTTRHLHSCFGYIKFTVSKGTVYCWWLQCNGDSNPYRARMQKKGEGARERKISNANARALQRIPPKEQRRAIALLHKNETQPSQGIHRIYDWISIPFHLSDIYIYLWL